MDYEVSQASSFDNGSIKKGLAGIHNEPSGVTLELDVSTRDSMHKMGDQTNLHLTLTLVQVLFNPLLPRQCCQMSRLKFQVTSGPL